MNTYLFLYINQFAGRYDGVDTAMLFVTHYLPYAMLALVCLYMLWWHQRAYPGALNRHYRFVQAVELVATLFVTGGVVQSIKLLVAEPRPFMKLAEVVLLVPDQGGYSFPSMHTALTMALAVSVLVHHRRLGLLLILFALLVGVSRMYVGVHYPIDVLVGAVIGAGIAIVLHRIAPHQKVADKAKTG